MPGRCCHRGRHQSLPSGPHPGRGEAPVKDATVYLRHIRDAIARIEKYTAQGREGFLEKQKALTVASSHIASPGAGRFTDFFFAPTATSGGGLRRPRG